MDQLERPGRANACPTCGGHVDHMAMACIMCGAVFQSQQPKDGEASAMLLHSSIFIKPSTTDGGVNEFV